MAVVQICDSSSDWSAGRGQYYAPTEPGSTEYVLQYDGDWSQGARHGTGTEYAASGEKYTGAFYRSQRHGHGRVEYVPGSISNADRFGKGT
jgi:hypothetical protein